MKVQKIKDILLIFLIFILSIVIVNVPWLNSMSGYSGFDIFNYINMLDSGIYNVSIFYDYNSLSSYILSEWLWRKSLVFFYEMGLSSDFIILFFIPFFIYFINLFILFKKDSLLYSWLLIHPVVLPFYLSQLRLAIAITLVFLVFTYIEKNKFIYLFIIPISLIHTSVLIFLMVFLLVKFILYKFNNKKILVSCLVFLGIILGYITGPIMGKILVAVGDRRADVYNESNLNSSILSSIYWGVILILFIISSFKIKKISFEIAVSVVFLSLLVFSPLFEGGYPYRFLSAIFILIILSLKSIDKINRYLILIVLIFTFIYQGITLLNWY